VLELRQAGASRGAAKPRLELGGIGRRVPALAARKADFPEASLQHVADAFAKRFQPSFPAAWTLKWP
jgi:hypothetical protein